MDCHCELPESTPRSQRYCCTEHANANKVVTCRHVVSAEKVNCEIVSTYCNGDAVFEAGYRVCTKCGKGRYAAQIVAQRSKDDSELGNERKRSAESLRLASSLWSNERIDPEHTSSWTKRRRL